MGEIYLCLNFMVTFFMQEGLSHLHIVNTMEQAALSYIGMSFPREGLEENIEAIDQKHLQGILRFLKKI